MQLAVVYLPFLQKYFNTGSLNTMAWLIVASTLGLAVILQQIFQAAAALGRKKTGRKKRHRRNG
jgi:hypothetical protein